MPAANATGCFRRRRKAPIQMPSVPRSAPRTPPSAEIGSAASAVAAVVVVPLTAWLMSLWLSFRRTLLSDPRSEDRVEQIHEQVHHGDRDTKQKHRCEDDRVIAARNAHHEVAANPGHLVNRFDKKSARRDICDDD